MVGSAVPAAAQPSDLHWDPLDASLKLNPYPLWGRLRDEAPVYYDEGHGFWALSRYADVDAAHRDPQTFSSAHGTVLELMSAEPLDTTLMIFTDPPRHTRLRRLSSRAFTPRRVSTLEPGIRALCGELLEATDGPSGFDFVQDFGARVPATVIAMLLGVPASDREEVRLVIDRIFHLEPGVGMINDVSIEAMTSLHDYLRQALTERRDQPGDDLLTDLVQTDVTEADGVVRRLTIDEATDFGILLISAGTETVARLIGWAGWVLGHDSPQRRRLASDPALLPNAVEELLRYEAPSPVQGRVTTAEVRLHGRRLPAGSKVLLLTGAAGRDERAFPDPDRFDVERRFDRHLAFGNGIHFCLGAALARLEGKIALEEMLRRYPDWEVDDDSSVLQMTSTVRGYSRLPVTA